MAVKVRLARAGAKKQPFYRIVVADQRSPRDGRCLEQIGTYDPRKDPPLVNVDDARLGYWLGVGAQPTRTVGQLLRKKSKAAALQP